MSHHRFHSFLSPSTVPFSWEDEPGISKESPRPLVAPREKEEKSSLTLPPPPSPLSSERPKLSAHSGHYVPLPPCPFQPASLKRRIRREEDPFLAAYLECTKNVKKTKEIRKRSGRGSGFSCKHVGEVRDDAILRLSRFTSSLNLREEEFLES